MTAQVGATPIVVQTKRFTYTLPANKDVSFDSIYSKIHHWLHSPVKSVLSEGVKALGEALTGDTYEKLTPVGRVFKPGTPEYEKEVNRIFDLSEFGKSFLAVLETAVIWCKAQFAKLGRSFSSGDKPAAAAPDSKK
jgi:hypothetical protein